MNTISTDFSFFIEHDQNPFVLFSSSGSILYLNKAAEHIVGIDTKKELFDLAVAYAPQSFGHRVALMELSFSSHIFYGINVLYNNDEEIGLYLYLRPRPKVSKKEIQEGFTATDLNLLLQVNIELFTMTYTGKLSLVTDYTMPHIQLHQNSVSLLLRKVFAQFSASQRLDIVLTVKIGSKIILEGKSYPIIALKLLSDHRDPQQDPGIRELALSNDIDMLFGSTSLELDIPAIHA